MNANLETFDIGSNSMLDIGGEEIDLKSLDLTDTLIGSCANELTQALGEADMNVFENYHLGDGNISDIELTTFDSALIQDAGIKQFTADGQLDEDDVNVSELEEILGKKAVKKASGSGAIDTGKLLSDLVHRALMDVNGKNFDSLFEKFVNDDRYQWHDSTLQFNNKGEWDEADDSDLDFTDADFDDDFDEMIALRDDIADGEFKETFSKPVNVVFK